MIIDMLVAASYPHYLHRRKVRRGILKPEEPGYVELAHALKNDLGQ